MIDKAAIFSRVQFASLMRFLSCSFLENVFSEISLEKPQSWASSSVQSASGCRTRIRARESSTWLRLVDRRLHCIIRLNKMLRIIGLNMESDLPSLFGLLCTAVLIGGDPAALSLPPVIYSYEGAQLVSQRKTTSLCNPLLRMTEKNTFLPS